MNAKQNARRIMIRRLLLYRGFIQMNAAEELGSAVDPVRWSPGATAR